MRIIPFFLFTLLLAAHARAENLVLMNGAIIDGTGKARALGNVRIKDGKITDIGLFRPAAGETLLDVKGMIVAPGFIDLENPSDPALVTNQISQGVTTAFLGSDGKGPYLIEEFMLPFDEKPTAMNIAMLVGHSTIRVQIMGPDYKRAATADEADRMRELLIEAGRQGAFGLASDLRNEPASFSTPEELSTLAKGVARFGGTWFVHPRDENVKELLDIARNAKATLQLSLNNLSPAVLADIDKARMQGLDVGAHIYSYTEPGAVFRSLIQNPATAISFAQFLRDDKAAILERVVQKLTGLPASRFGMRERGSLRKGIPADIVVFSPMSPSSGMKYVFINGTLVLKDGQPTDARPGQALR
jgi:N-acyl-D-aspartate/D-glutamate deacylase